MKTPVRTPRHLTILLGLALAACGGDGNQPAGQSDIDAKNINDDAAVASQSRATKAPPTELISEQSIRGDVLIQALLTETNKRNTDNSTQEIGWLSPVNRTINSDDGTSETTPLSSPAILLSQQIDTATAGDTLGTHIYSSETKSGPMYGGAAIESGQIAFVFVDRVATRFGVSAPGVQAGTNALAGVRDNTVTIGNRLELTREINPLNAFNEDYTPSVSQLSAEQTVSIKTDAQVPFGENNSIQSWSGTNARQTHRIMLYAEKGQAAGEFSLCQEDRISGVQRSYWTTCTQWEVPDNWTAGQPLTRKAQTVRYVLTSDAANVSSTTLWSNESGRTHIAQESLNKTSEPVNDFGISGATLAAMFDAFTPRAGGTQALPPYAQAVYTPLRSLTVAEMNPQQVRLYQTSRATQYQDGSSDAGSYSPATGSYLYSFRAGSTTAMTATRGFGQLTFAMNVRNDPAGTFTLPRWTGLHLKGLNLAGTETWFYQDEQRGTGNTAKPVAYTDLLQFGQPVQIWRDTEDSNAQRHTHVMLSIEKSRTAARTADLCWEAYVGTGNNYKVCTLYTIPAGWQAGQRLVPDGYYTVRSKGERWSTVETPATQAEAAAATAEATTATATAAAAEAETAAAAVAPAVE